jgi:hypothetical protein
MSLRQWERKLHTSARYPRKACLFFKSKPSYVRKHTQRIKRPRINVHFNNQTPTYESEAPPNACTVKTSYAPFIAHAERSVVTVLVMAVTESSANVVAQISLG